MDTKELIFELCSVCGVSGCEEPAAEIAKKYLSVFSDVTTDANGNLYAVLGNKNAEKTIIVDAHLDQIGLIVTEINDKGFVKVDKCGGIDMRTLLDTELVLQKNPEFLGIVCCMPPHLSVGKEDKAVSMDKIWVDFGLSYDEIKNIITVGDVLTFKSRPKTLINNRIMAACLDNRCGVAAAIKCAEILSKETGLKYKVCILLSAQEETYGTGAKTGSYLVNADEAIVIDVSFASQPDISGQYSSVELAKGPMICISSILNRPMSRALIETAEKNNIPYQLEPIAGRTGTNADHISVSAYGVKTAVVSIPQRYMHTPNEVIAIDDVENTAKLIADYIKCGGAFDA